MHIFEFYVRAGMFYANFIRLFNLSVIDFLADFLFVASIIDLVIIALKEIKKFHHGEE